MKEWRNAVVVTDEWRHNAGQNWEHRENKSGRNIPKLFKMLCYDKRNSIREQKSDTYVSGSKRRPNVRCTCLEVYGQHQILTEGIIG